MKTIEKFSTYFERCIPLLTSRAKKCAPDLDADDLVMSTFLPGFKSWNPDVHVGEKFLSLMCLVLKHRIFDQANLYKRRANLASSCSLQAFVDFDSLPEAGITCITPQESSDSDLVVDKLLSYLGPDDSDLLTRRFIQEYEVTEIMSALGIAKSTFYRRERLALNMLRENHDVRQLITEKL